MTPEHYDAYATERSALAELARTSPDEVFGACHVMLLELDALHPDTCVTEIRPRTYPTRTAAWQEAKKSLEALADLVVDGLRLALLLEALELARHTERTLAPPDARRER